MRVVRTDNYWAALMVDSMAVRTELRTAGPMAAHWVEQMVSHWVDCSVVHLVALTEPTWADTTVVSRAARRAASLAVRTVEHWVGCLAAQMAHWSVESTADR